MNLKSLLQGVPEIFQYIAVLGLVMLILYFCLKITAFLGRNRGKKEYYDDPEAYEKTVPNLFGSKFFKSKDEKAQEDKADEKKSD